MKNLKTILLASLIVSAATVVRADDEVKVETKNEPQIETPKTEEVKKVDPKTIFENKPHVILFKIHDIKPVVDADGVTTSCNYVATFFNRTPTGLRQAKIDLEWTDSISAQYLNDDPMTKLEKTEEPKGAEIKDSVKPVKVNPRDVVRATIDVPAIGSLKQFTIEGSVDTDKCFMLFDDVKYNVSSCSVLETETKKVKKADEKKDPCANMFQFVNSKNPEYYGEFKEVSYEELKEQKKTAEEKEQEEIKAAKEVVAKNFEEVKTILSGIK